MAQARGGTSRAKAQTATGAGAFVCPECGFQARHAMGLGRHRTSRHGVASKREQAKGGRRRTAVAPQDPGLRADLARVETKLDDVIQRLDALVAAARTEPPRRRRLGRG